jgi:integrase
MLSWGSASPGLAGAASHVEGCAASCRARTCRKQTCEWISGGRSSAPRDTPAGRQTRQAIDEHLAASGKRPGDFLCQGRRDKNRYLSTRQYARLLSKWIASVGLDPSLFGTHTLRRTKATLIYRRTGNLRAVQLLLGHTKVESTVRYLGIEVDDALAIAERIDV